MARVLDINSEILFLGETQSSLHVGGRRGIDRIGREISQGAAFGSRVRVPRYAGAIWVQRRTGIAGPARAQNTERIRRVENGSSPLFHDALAFCDIVVVLSLIASRCRWHSLQ